VRFDVLALTRNYSHLGGAVMLVLASLIAGALLCKVVHESGHALTAVLLGGTIESVRVRLPLPSSPGFFRIEYSLSGSPWRRGLAGLMGTGGTAVVAYALLLVAMRYRSVSWPQCVLLPVSVVCAWDMFLYGTLPLLGLHRFIVFGGNHAEPVEAAQMMGVPKWLFLSALALSFVVFHGLWYWALQRHG
jgi:hypothetical protein